MLLWACSSEKATDDNVYVVSIEPQRWILEQLVDTGTVIETMLQRGADPETFEPTINQRRRLAGSRIYFATGALPFEETIQEAAECVYINTSEGISPIYGTHSHSHNHVGHHHHGNEMPDPHVWTSVSGARQIARNMAKALMEETPDDTAKINERLARFESRLNTIDSMAAAKLVGAKSKAFAIWHPSLSYLARDYGLHQISVGMESKEMSARQVREVIDHALADSVRVFFMQKEYDTRQAATINEALGSRLVTIDPLSYDWERQITLIIDELSGS